MPEDPVLEEVSSIVKGQYLPGVIRTAVPAVVGYITAVLAAWGLSLDAAWVTRVVTVIAGVGYYALVRLWELKGKNWASRLLGSKKAPTFTVAPIEVPRG